MIDQFYKKLSDIATEGRLLSLEDSLRVLSGKDDILELIRIAYAIRRRNFGREVTVHILNNVQNGRCPEDCRYCAQSSSSEAAIAEYAMKSDAEILEEARAAVDKGAWRYCLVFAGTGPSDERVDHVCRIVREIKSRYRIEVCVSPGVVTRDQASKLKEAGLDRLNHNLNTSARHYNKICTTHSFQDRLSTLRAAKEVGLKVCSGVIIGMGEGHEDVAELAIQLREFNTESIPVNFFMSLPGVAIKEATDLTPGYCLRVLCLFRFLNPNAEIRMAGGREMHLRSLEPLGLYVANSLFLQGYLNARGAADLRTLRMIKDAGFTIRSEVGLDKLLDLSEATCPPDGIKSMEELRPYIE